MSVIQWPVHVRTSDSKVNIDTHTYLECASIWPDYPLPPLHKSLLVPHEVANFDDVARSVVLQDLDRLVNRDTTSHQLYHVSGFEDNVGVVSFSRRLDRHRTVDEIKCTCNSLPMHSVNRYLKRERFGEHVHQGLWSLRSRLRGDTFRGI